MHPDELKLIAELEPLLAKLREEQAAMRTVKANCICDAHGCCAWHTAIYNFLESSSNSLAIAIEYAKAPRDGGL